METCLNTINDENLMSISSDERKWINKIHSLFQRYPDDVIIRRQPDTNDGCIVAWFPKKWLKISPKRKVSEEERFKRSETLIKVRENLSNSNEYDEDEELIIDEND